MLKNRKCPNCIYGKIMKVFDTSDVSPKIMAFRVTLIYLFFAALWALVFDRIIMFQTEKRSMIFVYNLTVDCISILITSILIFLLVYNAMSKALDSKIKIEKSNTMISAILESSPDIIVFVLDNNYCYTTFNKKHKDTMMKLWGTEINLGMSIFDVMQSEEDRNRAKENFDRALTGESFSMSEYYGNEKLGRLYWQDYYSPIFSKKGEIIGLTCFCLNITELKKTEDENLYLSYHDALTGIYNRRYYEEQIRKLDTQEYLPLSIVMGDVNGLKLINDVFGHNKGDELLTKAARSIQSACRKDDIVARWGGDEFVILLPKTKTDEAEEVVNRIKESYSNEEINSIKISISFGWDTKYSISDDVMGVLKNAETLMYKHKITENEGVMENAVNTILNSLHEKYPREELHSKRVSQICKDIAKALGLPETEVSSIKYAGLLHDIGKVAIDEYILNKPGTLTDYEWSKIKRHSEIGFRLMNSSNRMLYLANCILSHHERWDGNGYPNGLKGEGIPRTARIIALADSYDAMTTQRTYKETYDKAGAVAEIRRNAGTQFDPYIAKVFVEKVLCEKWD